MLVNFNRDFGKSKTISLHGAVFEKGKPTEVSDEWMMQFGSMVTEEKPKTKKAKKAK
jgi:hypothetical protein